MRRRSMGTALAAALVSLPALAGAAQASGVDVTRGATPLENGDATKAGDITLRNSKLAVSIAAESAPPWGVAPGGIVDAAPVRNGKAMRDKLSLVDLIPNNWSSWPTTYQNFEIVEDGPKRGVVEVTRDWNKVTMVTRYTLEEGSNRVHMVTTMTNEGDKAHNDILSGYVLWPDGGNFFSVPGMQGVEEGKTKGKALADWSAGYDENWTIALHAPYVEYVDYDSRDLYLKQSLKPGDSKTFEGWLQILPSGDLGPVVAAETERKGLGSAELSGNVATSDGKDVETPVVVIEKDGKPYAWTLGDAGAYSMTLPKGQYSAYATAKAHAQSSKAQIKVADGQNLDQDFKDLKAPGRLKLSVAESGTATPLDARVTVKEGQTPLVGFLGRKTFFTDLNKVGDLTAQIAPGDYVFEVAAGRDFLAQATDVEATVTSGQTAKVQADVVTRARPNARGWYSADMHHHSDILDGYTAPEYVVRSQLAAGLDLVLLSDHDSMANLGKTAEYAAARDVPFIPSVEISPSWAHFNPYPVELGQELEINPGTASIHEILDEVKRLGAHAVQANHPYIPYGYYTSLNKDDVPGGFNPSYDLIELNGSEDPEKALKKARTLWNAGERYYITGGSDVHDVWLRESGMIRSFAHVSGEVTPDKFVTALKDGHAFVSEGPLVYPETMFGDQVKVKTGNNVDLGFTLQAANGLKSVALRGKDGVIAEKSFKDAPNRAEVSFAPKVTADGWYSLVVTDSKDKSAYTNPIWVDAVEHKKMQTAEAD